jgi:2-C-methyl-D-erythritol 2,4-cyclodiphosphate synthase
MRIGSGFDVHSLKRGSSITLCGIEIPHNYMLVGHSDADVAMHALTDAIFGALAAGDIGQHFPSHDDAWQGVKSEIFLTKAVSIMTNRQYSICNIDITIICEEPKINKHSLVMRKNIGRLSGVEIDRVSIKATTSEKIGFTGRNEGIASMASVLLSKNE